VIILDSLLIGGLRFVLGKIAQAVDAEMNEEQVLREELLAAQMRLELGELSPEEFATLERQLLARLRRARQTSDRGRSRAGTTKVTGVEARAWDDNG
jgi:Gas vesicle protein G